MDEVLQITKNISLAVLALFALYELLSLARIQKAYLRRKKEGRPCYFEAELIRPFTFLCMTALYFPVSLIALYVKEVASGFLGLNDYYLMSIPISIDMGCIGLGSLLTVMYGTRLGGYRRLILIGIISSIVGMFLTAIATNGYEIVIGRIFYGIGYCGIMMGVQLYVIRNSPFRTRSENLSNIYAGVFSGILVGAYMGTVIASDFGMRYVFFASSGCFVLFLALYLYILRTRQEQETLNPVTSSFTFAGAYRFLKTPSVMGVLVLQIIPYGAIAVGLFNYYIPTTLKAAGHDVLLIGQVTMIYSVTVIILTRLSGKLMDRIEYKYRMLTVASVLCASSCMLFYVLDVVTASALVMFLLGVVSALNEGGQVSVLTSYRESLEFGLNEATASVDTFMRVGQMIGPYMIAAAIVHAGEYGLMIVCAGGLAVSVLFTVTQLRARRYTEKDLKVRA